jgi:transcription elongation factor Elf1
MSGTEDTMIHFTCGQCGHELRAQERLSGKHMKCSKCGASVRIPPAPVTHSKDSVGVHEPRLIRLREEIKESRAVAEVKKDETELQFREPLAPVRSAPDGRKSRLAVRTGTKRKDSQVEKAAKLVLAFALMVLALSYAATQIPAFSKEVDWVRSAFKELRTRWRKESAVYSRSGREAEPTPPAESP